MTERRCVGVRVLRELPFFLPQSFTLIGASLRTSLGSMRCSAMMMMTGVIPELVRGRIQRDLIFTLYCLSSLISGGQVNKFTLGSDGSDLDAS